MDVRATLLFDATPEAWAQYGAQGLQEALAATVFAANMHAASSAGACTALVLFSQTGAWDAAPLVATCGAPLSAHAVQSELLRLVREEDAVSAQNIETAPERTMRPMALPGVLSRALCAEAAAGGAPGPICLVAPRQLAPLRYVPLMNCAFAAAAQHIPVDVVLVAPADCENDAHSGRHGLLHQIAGVAGGVFHRVAEGPAGVAARLALLVGVPHGARGALVLGEEGPGARDMRPSCFCHGRTVARGFVCSVCLSVFCAFAPVCPTCRAKVDFTRGLAT